MTPERWARIAAIVDSALLEDASTRAAFVAQICGADAELRREVESLLVREPAIEGFLKHPAADVLAVMDRDRLLAGERIGPYVIVARIGSGGMGEVYRARDTHLDREVAVKVLPQTFAADAARVAQFEREARALAALNHPRIGAIYAIERIDGIPALILELVEGPTLAERLATGPLPRVEAVATAIQIAEALEAAHARGIIHRDIKPANIKMVRGSIKVLDFGLAKDASEGDGACSSVDRPQPVDGLSVAGVIMGTAAYMSPEQAEGEKIDSRTDLFSLGVVLHEMLTGRPSSTADPALPRSLEPVVRRLLEPQRDNRYQTAAAVLADLRSAIGATARRRLVVTSAATTVLAVSLVLAWIWFRDAPVTSPGEYTQVTYFPDYATSPALSRDGRMVTFIRGESTFEGPGDIYVKPVTGGNAVQLTSDTLAKMSPVFTPDGTRIAYTTVNSEFSWETWTVPISGGTPQRWLSNASGLTWLDDHRLLFAEMTRGLHMRVVAGDDRDSSRLGVYDPTPELGMAHHSYPSPDGAWVLIAEMIRPVWQRCRLVAIDGRETHAVGPEGQCTTAGWSPDGKWMYFSSNASGTFHIWRQRFPDGTLEQITNGPTEEEGIAVAPDGGSLLTSVGNRQSSIWAREAAGEREVSTEGYAFIPAIPNAGMSRPFSNDGRLLYLVRRGALRFGGPGERAGELWETNPRSSQSQALFPGFLVSGYDVSRDNSTVVFAALDERGASHLWLGRMEDRTPPRQLITAEGDSPRFGRHGSIYYRGFDRGSAYVYRIDAAGIARKVLSRPVAFFLSVSPDEAWIVARVQTTAGDSTQENVAFRIPDGARRRLCGATCEVDWTPDGLSLIVRVDLQSHLRTYVLPLTRGEMFPRWPAGGLESDSDLRGLHVSRTIDNWVYEGNDPTQVVEVRRTTQRNLYRVPLH